MSTSPNEVLEREEEDRREETGYIALFVYPTTFPELWVESQKTRFLEGTDVPQELARWLGSYLVLGYVYTDPAYLICVYSLLCGFFGVLFSCSVIPGTADSRIPASLMHSLDADTPTKTRY